jgi:hypothetical protein
VELLADSFFKKEKNMANDFLKNNTEAQFQGQGIVVNQAPSSGNSFLSAFLPGVVNALSGGGQEAKMKKEKDKLGFYTELRKAGYSPEEASKRVNKQFSGGGIMSKILGKNDAAFEPPAAGTDTLTAKADEEKASAKLKSAQADWYSRRSGSPSGTGGSGDTQRMKTLQTAIQMAQDELSTATEKNTDQRGPRRKLEKYQKALDKLVGADDSEGDGGNKTSGRNGFPKADSSWGVMPQYVPGQTRPGQAFMHQGKKYKVDPNDPGDPNDPNVIPAE